LRIDKKHWGANSYSDEALALQQGSPNRHSIEFGKKMLVLCMKMLPMAMVQTVQGYRQAHHQLGFVGRETTESLEVGRLMGDGNVHSQ
jgi:hypothetical protein